MYNAYITEIKEIKKHSNADRLFLTECFGNQVIIDGSMKVGDTVVYFPTDGRLSEEYCQINNLIGSNDPVTGEHKGGYFDSRRKISTLKLRKEVSDGFIMPIESLSYTGIKIDTLKPGMMFETINGYPICEKYVTQATRSHGQNQGKPGKRSFRETISYPIFSEHKDTEQMFYNMNQLKEGMVLVITVKMHGTSGRTSYSLCEKTSKIGNIINYVYGNIFKKKLVQPKSEWKYVSGTRRVTIKDIEKRNSGFYGDKEEFRTVAHNLFLEKLAKGETVYYEIVGWVSPSTPIMSKVSNEKLKDKEFVKKYGKETIFNYGCLPGRSEVYVYRMSMTNVDGIEVDYDWETVKRRCEEMSIKHVVEVDKFIYMNICFHFLYK